MIDKLKKPWDALITDEEREDAVKKTIAFFLDERDEEIGVVAAEQVLNMFMEMLGPKIFNTGVMEGKEWLKVRLTDMEIDYDTLLQ